MGQVEIRTCRCVVARGQLGFVPVLRNCNDVENLGSCSNCPLEQESCNLNTSDHVIKHVGCFWVNELNVIENTSS